MVHIKKSFKKRITLDLQKSCKDKAENSCHPVISIVNILYSHGTCMKTKKLIEYINFKNKYFLWWKDSLKKKNWLLL